MSGLNKVMLIGRLGRDPETRWFEGGRAMSVLSIATSERHNDQDGHLRERTEWHRVVIFGKLAEVARQYLTKGSQIYIEGQLRTRKWTDQQNIERYTTEIIVQGYNGTMQMLGTAPQ